MYKNAAALNYSREPGCIAFPIKLIFYNNYFKEAFD